MKDIERLYNLSIQKALKLFPCVVVLGARQTGKTTILKQVWPTATSYDLENEEHYERIKKDPLFFLDNARCPLIFDEAQLLPELFKALRVKIDQNRKQTGQYLLSGSSSPELLSQVSESLAGRVAIIELPPLTWSECFKKPQSNFYQILIQKTWDQLDQLKPLFNHKQLYESCLKGTYPEPFLKRKTTDFSALWMNNYFNTYIHRDIRRLFPTLNIENYRRFIKMLMIGSGEIVNVSNYSRSLGVSQPTAKNYFDIAEGTFLWRSLLSYQSNQKKRLIKAPKGYIRDSGLIHHSLNISTVDDMQAHPRWGNIWECFVCEQIIRNIQSLLYPQPFYHYRTQEQAEVDLVLEGPFGLVPIEIKLSKTIKHYDLFAIENFIETHNLQVGFVISMSQETGWLSKKVFQIPAIFI